MLKNLSPIISGELLRALDETPSGSWIAMVSRAHHDVEGIVAPESTIEDVAAALLAVTPLDPDAPIVAEGEGEPADSVFAVAGLAADAEGRRFKMLAVSELAFGALLTECHVVVVVDDPVPFGFLLCKGRC
ncbi:hypothetical protein [Humibacter sp. RRB41]|uniref:hypothetical protein n=1 Tax=Humibacter sp. RRB41 TaxID=2919946 RepID=UPI001FAAB6F8|nr:hypothetical protein [Humibacter sp. RRB41]